MKITLTIVTSVMILVCLGFTSCRNELTPNEEITKFIADAEKNSEKKNIGGIKKLIAEDYADRNRNSRQDIVRIAAGYFLRNQSIFVLTIQQSIEISTNQNSAKLSILAAVSSSPLDFDDLRLLQAEFHAFELVLKKEDTWLLKTLEWKQSSADDFVNAIQ